MGGLGGFLQSVVAVIYQSGGASATDRLLAVILGEQLNMRAPRRDYPIGVCQQGRVLRRHCAVPGVRQVSHGDDAHAAVP